MLLTEAAGKRLLRTAFVPTADGVVVQSEQDLTDSAPWPFPVAAKAQVAAGGRGKAGGIIACDDEAALRDAFTHIMGSTFSGEAPSGVLIEPWLTIERELYLSVVLDPSADGYTVLYSPTGGVEIESADTVVRYPFGDPADFRGHLLREAISGVESDESVREHVVSFARSLLDIATRFEATTVEINPLAYSNRRLIAVDAKVVLDDSAVFRQSVTAEQLAIAYSQEDEVAAACRAARLVFVPLGGSVGLVSGGAGMTMRAMDAVSEAGGSAAGFLDISSNPTPDGIAVAVESLQQLEGVDRILISIFGGGLDVGRIAKSLVGLLDSGRITLPVAFRLSGSGRDAATTALDQRGLTNHDTLESAVAELMTKEVVA
ncbi:ATP-grasp domain-containing protein [Microbacterium sp. A84]